MDLHGKSALVTGCGSGIGRGLARALLQRGARVLATDQDADALARALEGISDTASLELLPLDVRNWDHWHRAVARIQAAWGSLDFLMNVAGVSHSAAVHEATRERIDLHVDVNVRGLAYGVRAAAPIMVSQRSGHIFNIASVAGLIPIPGMSLYSSSKFAVRGFSLAIAEELIQHNVFVTCVCPDAVATAMLDHEALEPEASLSFAGSRILTVEEVVEAMLGPGIARRPREMVLPPSMNLLARVTTALPGLSDLLLPYFRRRGIKNQQRYRELIERRNRLGR